MTGIAGSCKLGDFVVLGARAGISDHVTIGEGAHLAAMSVVHRRCSGGRAVGWYPGPADERMVPRNDLDIARWRSVAGQ